jgi:drug/metabolite transporter (DMT)-like permease
MGEERQSMVVGVLAALASVGIGVGWQVATRLGATTSLAPIDLALLRYSVPALVLSPLWWRSGLKPVGVSWRLLILMLLGAGFPFGLTAMAGAVFAPTAHMGVLLPGTMPLFVALLSALVLGERFSTSRMIGFAAIVLGALTIGVPALMDARSGAWRGDLLFVLAALLWAVYTVAYRKSGLSPWTSAAVICAWSAVMAVVAWGIGGGGRLFSAPARDVALQVVWQGGLAGIGGLALFALAVKHLGPSRAALSGALVPVSSAVAGWAALSEPIHALTALGIALTTVGVGLAAGLADLLQRPLDKQEGSPR